jgi:hypothetical protein
MGEGVFSGDTLVTPSVSIKQDLRKKPCFIGAPDRIKLRTRIPLKSRYKISGGSAVLAQELRPDAMLSCISTAQRTAADGLANSANALSPVVLISRPSWRERPGSITSRFNRSNSA